MLIWITRTVKGNSYENMYVGAQPLARAGEIVLLQAFWTAVFVLAGRAWIGRSFQKLVIQGG